MKKACFPWCGLVLFLLVTSVPARGGMALDLAPIASKASFANDSSQATGAHEDAVSLDAALAMFRLLAGVSLAVSIISMAVLQLLKEISPLRFWVQRWLITRQLSRKARLARVEKEFVGLPKKHCNDEKREIADALKRVAERISATPSEKALKRALNPRPPWLRNLLGHGLLEDLRDLSVHLSSQPSTADTKGREIWEKADRFSRSAASDLARMAPGGMRRLFDLPIEQLCGQLNVIMQDALAYPERHKELVWCFGLEAGVEDLNKFAPLKPNSASGEQANPSAQPPNNAGEGNVAARNRVASAVQRTIDGLQISTEARWKFSLQIGALAISTALTCLALTVYRIEGLSWLKAISAGLFGGFLAPIERDLIAALQRMRR